MPRARAAAIAEIRELIAAWGLTFADLFDPEPRQQSPRAPAKAPQRPRTQPRVVKPQPPAAAPATTPPSEPIVTIAAPRRFDPRYQCDPAQPVEGAGFVRDWHNRRSSKGA